MKFFPQLVKFLSKCLYHGFYIGHNYIFFVVQHGTSGPIERSRHDDAFTLSIGIQQTKFMVHVVRSVVLFHFNACASEFGDVRTFVGGLLSVGDNSYLYALGVQV